MGFFESLKRMAEGKPVFDVNDQTRGWVGKDGQQRQVSGPAQAPQQAPQTSQQQPEASKSSIIKGNSSTFPVVYVRRTRTQLSGSNQTVYVSILNSWNEPVELEEFDLMGRSQHLSAHLQPGQEREFMVYSGSRSSREGHREATLNFKTEMGDYFQALHDVEYQMEQDQTYSVEELRLRQPIRDIYG